MSVRYPGGLMRRLPSLILTLLAITCLPLVLAACGGGVPGNAVAVVDGESIEKSSFDSWMEVAARGGGQSDTSVPQPPDYKECIAAKRKAQPEPEEGQQPPDDEQLKDQ